MILLARNAACRSANARGPGAVLVPHRTLSATSTLSMPTPIEDASTTPPRPSNKLYTLDLPKRRITYSQYGAPGGFPILYLHGYPSSRLEGAGLHAAGYVRGVRIVAPDRPGFGQSSPVSGRTIGSYPADDIAALVADLGLQKGGGGRDGYAVVGCSGGGPYAIACGANIKDPALRAVHVVAGGPPWFAPGGRDSMARYRRIAAVLAMRAPGVLRAMYSAVLSAGTALATSAGGAKRIDAWLETQPADPGDDRSTAERRAALIEFIREPFAQGVAAAVEEAALLVRKWDVQLANAGAITLWHGVDDPAAPIGPMRWLAEQMPEATLNELQAGHYDMGKHFETVLDALLAEVDSGARTVSDDNNSPPPTATPVPA